MKNLKKLTREELRNVAGGRACSIAIQQPNGSWITYPGSCGYVSGGGGQGSMQCNIGTGLTYELSSNGGVSRCEN